MRGREAEIILIERKESDRKKKGVKKKRGRNKREG